MSKSTVVTFVGMFVAQLLAEWVFKLSWWETGIVVLLSYYTGRAAEICYREQYVR